jgi:hypothetical protein
MTLRNQLRDLGMKLDMAAQELRAIRDPAYRMVTNS